MTPALVHLALGRLRAKQVAMEQAAVQEARHQAQPNAQRLASLGHALERANNKECCVKCTIHYDDGGLIVGATHYRFSLTDVNIAPPGQPPVMAPGLRSLLSAGRATLDPNDNLSIDGTPV